MKLYRANKYDRDLGTLVSWHSSKRDAETALREFDGNRAEDSWQPGDVEQVNVPTNRTDLIRWLNSNLSTDNG